MACRSATSSGACRVRDGWPSSGASNLTSPGRNDWLVRSTAAVLCAGEDAALSHNSAAFTYGLKKAPGQEVEILIPHTRRVRSPVGAVVRAAGGTADEAIALAAMACQKGLTWDQRLLEVLDKRPGHPWTSLLRDALLDIGEGAQSTFEVRYVRDVERAHGLPKGRLQQPTGGGRRHHDVGYDEQKVLIELDGLAFHSTPQARIVDGRRDRGTVIEGWATVRAFWPDVAVTPCLLARDVGSLLSRRGWSGVVKRCRRRNCAVPRPSRGNPPPP